MESEAQKEIWSFTIQKLKVFIRFTLANEFSKIFQHHLCYALYITFNFIVMSGMLLQRQSKSL